MNQKVARSSVALILCVAMGALAACSGAGESAETSRSDTIVVGTIVVPNSLDPLNATEVQTDFTVEAMYDTLIDYDADGKVVPAIATSWKYASDRKSVTLELRDDVKFHSGNQLTADDVVATLDRAKKLGVGVAQILSNYDSATAVNATTVTINLKNPDTGFVGALGKAYIIDSALLKEHLGSDDGQQWLASNDAGSGPYKLTNYTANQEAAFSRFDDSWRFEAARPDNLIYRYVPSSAALRDELRAGNIDVAGTDTLTGADLKTVQETDAFDSVETRSLLETYVALDTLDGPTADPRVREAIQLAFDYEAHIQSTFQDRAGDVPDGILPAGMVCRAATGSGTYDLDKAKQLIDEAGASGTDLTIVFQAVIPEHQQIATLYQSQLKKIGLNLKLQTVTFPQYVQLASDPATTPDMAVIYDFPFYPEVAPMMARNYLSSLAGQTNLTWYKNPDVDGLIQTGLTDPDAKTACDALTEAQEKVAADRVTVNVSNPNTIVVMRKGISGMAFRPLHAIFDTTLLVQK